MRSILQRDKCCYICKTEQGLNLHHCIHGTANRKLADEDGLTVWLCWRHHQEVHANADLDNTFKYIAQMEYQHQNNKTTEEWIQRYGKSWM